MAEQTIQIADKPTVDEILALLENPEVGLAALKAFLGKSADAATLIAVKGLLESGTYGLAALDNDLETIVNYLTNGIYGLGAIKEAVTGRANETTLAAVKALLESGTYGLNALKTAISNADKFSSTTAGVLQINAPVEKIGNTRAVAYSAEFSISGNGQITFHGITDDGLYSSRFFKLVDIIIDGCAIPNARDIDVNAFILDTTYDRRIKLEFSKSFRCKLETVYSISSSDTIKTCTTSVKYYAQLR